MKKTLVIGASLNPARYSNLAIRTLLEKGHQVETVGLRSGQVAGVTINTEQKMFEDIDTVTLYLNQKRQASYYDYIVQLKPRRVIFNPGTENPILYKLLKENDIEFEIACTLVLLRTNQY